MNDLNMEETLPQLMMIAMEGADNGRLDDKIAGNRSKQAQLRMSLALLSTRLFWIPSFYGNINDRAGQVYIASCNEKNRHI